MYGLVEVDVSIVRKAYRFLKNDTSIEQEDKSGIMNTIRGLMGNGVDKVQPYNNIQCRQVREILADIVYASYISSSEYIMIKIEIAGIIQDIIELYEQRNIKILNTIDKHKQEY